MTKPSKKTLKPKVLSKKAIPVLMTQEQLAEVQKRHAHNEAAYKAADDITRVDELSVRFGPSAHDDREDLLAHIRALEAERATVRREAIEECAALLNKMAADERAASVSERAKGDTETSVIYARYANVLSLAAEAIRSKLTKEGT